MPRPDKRAERIPQIIQATMRVFARKGFAETRMEDIGHEAGLSKATLYLYFASKEDVIMAILQSFFEQGVTDLAALRASDGPVSQRLIGWTRQRLQELQGQAAFLSIGFEFHAIAARQVATRQVMQEYYHQYQINIEALLQTGIERGEFQVTDVHEMAIAIMSVYEGLTVLWMLDAATIDLVEIAARTVQILLGSITKAA
jgi:TetR/AcrR family fatty acid metabolism transcriptional regulator